MGERAETEYAVIRCRPNQSLRTGTIERAGFTAPAEAAEWRRKNAPGAAFQVARIVNGFPAFLTDRDDLEIAVALR